MTAIAEAMIAVLSYAVGLWALADILWRSL